MKLAVELDRRIQAVLAGEIDVKKVKPSKLDRRQSRGQEAASPR